MKKFLRDMYMGLGNTKAQRFRRLMYLVILISGVTVYGFKSEAIKISLGFGTESSK